MGLLLSKDMKDFGSSAGGTRDASDNLCNGYNQLDPRGRHSFQFLDIMMGFFTNTWLHPHGNQDHNLLNFLFHHLLPHDEYAVA